MLVLTRTNKTRRGYSKCDDREISLSESGRDELVAIIAATNQSKRAPCGWSFGIYEDGEVSKATWRSSTAIILPYQIDGDIDECHRMVLEAAHQLPVAKFILDAEERDGTRTVVVVIPSAETMDERKHARLTGVYYDEMRALGVSLNLSGGASAMTHQLHIHAKSEVVWMPGPVMQAKAKIKATEKASQQHDYQRMSAGVAASAQLDKPVLTACDGGLFEW